MQTLISAQMHSLLPKYSIRRGDMDGFDVLYVFRDEQVIQGPYFWPWQYPLCSAILDALVEVRPS